MKKYNLKFIINFIMLVSLIPLWHTLDSFVWLMIIGGGYFIINELMIKMLKNSRK